jgi:hypothetical protein
VTIDANSVPLSIRVNLRDGFMSVKLAGTATLGNVTAAIESISDETIRHNAKRLLVDLTQVSEQLGFVDHAVISDRAATHYGHLEKVASVVADGHRRGTSEQAGQLRGIQLRVFTSREEAAAWLEI